VTASRADVKQIFNIKIKKLVEVDRRYAAEPVQKRSVAS